MAGIDNVCNLPYNSFLTCVEPSQSKYDLLQNNQRSEETVKTPDGITDFLRFNMRIETATRTIEKRIAQSRETRNYKQAHIFTSDASQVVPGAVWHHICMEHLLNYNAGTSTQGGSVPVYFEPVFEMSWGDLARFEHFVKSVDNHLITMAILIMKDIEHGIRQLSCLFQTPEFRNLSEEDQLRISRASISAIVSKRTRMQMCEDKMKVKFDLVMRFVSALDVASSELNTVSVDSARKILKLRDAFYYSLEEYEKCFLDTLRVMREIYLVS